MITIARSVFKTVCRYEMDPLTSAASFDLTDKRARVAGFSQGTGIAQVPGYFDTPLNAALVVDPEFRWLAKPAPAGRRGNVVELVRACIFRSSDASTFGNGRCLFVDGSIVVSL